LKKSRPCYNLGNNGLKPALVDLDLRFKTMDKFEGLKQVLTLAAPPIEYAVSPKDAVDLARMANDEMAELVNKYPDRFVAAVASLPMSDVDAFLREAERAIKDLKFKGIQIFSSINGKPLDSLDF
jgi:predicted TIM-barrel fold metal-dependent hydrolase